MARRAKAEEERSMDSLMDAMTNVVGVLLLILIVSSLSITDAVKKIVENIPEVSVEELESMKISRDKTLENLAALQQTQTQTQENVPTPDEAAQLSAELDELLENNKDLADKTSDIEEWKAKVEELEEKKAENEQIVLASDQKNKELAAILAQTPEAVVKAAKDVKKPNPRVADAEASALYLVCVNQKLYYFGDPYQHALSIRDVIDKNFTDLAFTGKQLGSYTYALKGTRKDDNDRFIALKEDYRLTRGKEKDLAAWDGLKMTMAARDGKELADTTVLKRIFGSQGKAELTVQKFKYDLKKITAFFGDGKFGPKDFKYYVEKGAGDRIKFSVGFREDGGWTQGQFSAQNSEFDQLCKTVSNNRRSLFYYYVAPDSFDTYLQARSRSEFHGIQAGWTIWEGEKLSPKAIPQRSTIRYNLNSLPTGDYMKIANAVGPYLVQELNNEHKEGTSRIAAAVPKEADTPEKKKKFIDDLTVERADWTYSRLQNWAIAPFTTALAAQEATREEEIQIEIHPPEIPQIRVFTPDKPPAAPKPPVDPNAPKPKPKPPTGGGTKLILD